MKAKPADSLSIGLEQLLLRDSSPCWASATLLLHALLHRPGNGGHPANQAPEHGNICPQFSSYMKGGFACDQDLQRRTGNFFPRRLPVPCGRTALAC
jgi:hypothetical protein